MVDSDRSNLQQGVGGGIARRRYLLFVPLFCLFSGSGLCKSHNLLPELLVIVDHRGPFPWHLSITLTILNHHLSLRLLGIDKTPGAVSQCAFQVQPSMGKSFHRNDSCVLLLPGSPSCWLCCTGSSPIDKFLGRPLIRLTVDFHQFCRRRDANFLNFLQHV